eukprot:c5293_g1_i1.p1 GENE.c5293_g1_i1~~c5293_g1_i1.p1  ORF type:complete len:817 (-),score=240.02 c5293_g1_i1:361-2769(-)
MSQPRSADKSSVVALLVDDLVKRWAVQHGPQNAQTRAAFESKMLQYCLSIIGSRITPSCECDETTVSRLVHTQLTESGKQASIGQFDSLARRTLKTGLLQTPWQIIYLLYSIGKQHPVPSARLSDFRPSNQLAFPGNGERMRVYEASTTAATTAPPASTATASKQLARHIEVLDTMTTNEALIRDVIFSFQGVDSGLVKFDSSSGTFAVSAQMGISAPYQELTLAICELGWLYRHVNAFVSRHVASSQSSGLVAQSFASALRAELVDFYRLVAVLESQAGQHTTADKRLTLRRLLVWVYDPMQKLKVMAMLADAATGLKGGQLASCIDKHKHHGDPAVRDLVVRVMGKTCVPIFDMLRKWIFDGVLEDPHQEFFVACQTVNDDRLWHDKYSLRQNMLLEFFQNDLARKVLNTGKAVNFIRAVCNDTEWVLENINELAQQKMEYGNETSVTQIVDQVAQKTQRHLLTLLFDKHKLARHARAIKRYLLLGQGDFATHLMDMLGPELSKPSQHIYNHNLSSILESAVRASNAQFDDPAVLNCLDALVLTRTAGEEGWDVFSMSYVVQSPVTIMLTPSALTWYRKIFNFIWRLKRVLRYLAASWHDDMFVSRWSQTLLNECPQSQGFFRYLRKCHRLRSDMYYVVKQLEYFFMFEVLECSWQSFEKEMKEAKDLDEVLSAHTRYLQRLVSRILLIPENSTKPSNEQASIYLSQMFDNMLKFRKMQEALVKAQKRAADLLRIHQKNRSQDPNNLGKLMEISNLLTIPDEFAQMFEEVSRQHTKLLTEFQKSLKDFPEISLRSLLSTA